MGRRVTSALISAQELSAVLGTVKLLDASFHQPPAAQGIPGTVDFDIDDIADPSAPFAHTIPTPELFAAKVGALGIANTDTVVVYDRSGMAMAAARAWWMFRLYGHDNVRMLDGGLPAWLRAGLPIAEKNTQPKPAAFKAAFRPELLKLRDDMYKNITDKNFTVLDARDAPRFQGLAPDPRPGVGAGHIPGAQNLPFTTLLNPDGTLKAKPALPQPPAGAIACSCGSGVTACVIALALYELGRADAAVYDGSWTEWGSDPATPKATGA